MVEFLSNERCFNICDSDENTLLRFKRRVFENGFIFTH